MSALMTIGELARSVAAQAVNGDVRITFGGVSTDTRSLVAGDLFVALRGDRFDAHEFIGRAVERGAVAALVDHPVDIDVPQIVVANTRRALGVGAAQWRARFSIPVIAVAGSNGKTTVTQMIAAILAQAFGEKSRLATRGNLNNEIGVPLMLWQLGRQHRAAVFELGMNHPGEIATLAEWVRPTIALVNNAQREHQEFMQSVEATALENGEVIAALPLSEEGAAVFPADDVCAPIWRRLAGTRRMVDFALDGEAVITATFEAAADSTGTRATIATPGGVIDAKLAVSGAHNVRNALAATACSVAAGIESRAIRAGLEAFRPVAGRGVRLVLPGGAQLIDDTYNANPDSMRAAIDLLAGFPGRRLLVVGDMGEVGEHGPAFHREIGAYARERDIDALFAIGASSTHTATAFGHAGMHFESLDSLLAALAPQLAPDVTLLVKGSRFMQMERVVDALTPTRSERVH